MKNLILIVLVWCTSSMCANAQTQSDDLFEAAKNNNTQVISSLLDNGMAVDTIAENGATPLFVAAQNQSYDAAALLIERGADVNYVNSKAIGATPLMIAASRNNIDLTALMLDHGAAIDKVDVNNDPAINWAAYYGYTDMVEFLVSRGASTNITGHGTPREIAIRRGHQDLVLLLSDYAPSESEQELLQAIEDGDIEQFEQLLASGASPDSLDESGRPVIGMAARQGLSDFVAALIDAGADIDLPDEIGFTPLMEAAREGQVETANLLLTAGADPNHRSKPSALGFLPMHLAALSDNRDMIELLLKFDADIDPRDRDSLTPIMWALSEGKRSGVIALLANGADPYLETSSGYSSAQAITSMKDDELLGYLKPKQ